jgi:transcriptional regulator with XRE-family HTH domain
MKFRSDRLGTLLEKAKITQSELALKIGISDGVVSNYLSGKKQPSFDTLGRIADVFVVSTDYLLGRDDEVRSDVGQDLTFQLNKLLESKRLRTPAQISLFTNAALTADELQRLLDGTPPGDFSEEKLVKFFRKFNLDLIRKYYAAAGLPLPQEFQDLESDLREVISRVRMSTDGSPEALEAVIQVAKDIWAMDEELRKK